MSCHRSSYQRSILRFDEPFGTAGGYRVHHALRVSVLLRIVRSGLLGVRNRTERGDVDLTLLIATKAKSFRCAYVPWEPQFAHAPIGRQSMSNFVTSVETNTLFSVLISQISPIGMSKLGYRTYLPHILDLLADRCHRLLYSCKECYHCSHGNCNNISVCLYKYRKWAHCFLLVSYFKSLCKLLPDFNCLAFPKPRGKPWKRWMYVFPVQVVVLQSHLLSQGVFGDQVIPHALQTGKTHNLESGTGSSNEHEKVADDDKV